MNNEIKEILDNIEVNELKHHKWYCSVEKDNMQKILDYITNLQQEKDDLYLDNTMLKMEKDIYKTGYEELKALLSSLQNGSDSQ